MNIIDAILFQCRRQPPIAAICVPGQDRGLISYRRLEASIYNISRRLLALGLAPGSVVAVNIHDTILHAATLLALTRLGLVTLTIGDGPPPVPFKIDALITDVKLPASTNNRIMAADTSWMEGDGQAVEGRAGEDDICHLVLTPGSNGTADAVAISQRLLSNRIGHHLTVFGNRFPRCDRFYCDMPISTSVGFQMLIYSLLRGGTIIFSGERFDSTLLAIEEYKAQCLIASPEGLDAFVQGFNTIRAYQSSVELVVCCGQAPSPALLDDARLRLCSHLVSAYDSAEAGSVAAGGAHELAGRKGAVGFVTPGTAVQIVDQSANVLPPGREGLIRIKSQYTVAGYFGAAEETAKHFRDGWFVPGDVGVLDADSLLVITGRRQ